MKELVIFLSIGLLLLLGASTQMKVKAESSIEHNKQEFRGIWVATVASIDIGYHYTEAQYKEEYLDILDTVEEFNFNAIIFQVRPTNDAFYPSTLSPWSKYLTGIEGQSPGWDVLGWMIEETHKRGIEFHAWLNPYRVSLEKVGINYATKEDLISSLTTKNFARKHPDYVLMGGDNGLILNPGEPDVKEFIVDTIDEIINNYDVDAIHFDDYFYPYSGVVGDQQTYETYKNVGESIDDWRRRNVDEVIENISIKIHTFDSENNKAVQFGISPFGVWRNQSTDSRGSDTMANQSYDTQYADTRKWVKEEWLDYIVPQLYWEIGHSLADYETLSTWWADVVSGTKVNLYTGNAIYRYGTNSAWNSYDQLPRQLFMNNEHEEIKGSIFFSYKHLNSASSSALITGRTYIKERMWDTLALPPKLPLINETVPGQIANVTTTTAENNASFDISWDQVENCKYYAVYRFEKDQTVDLTDPVNLYSVVSNEVSGDTITFIDTNLEEDTEYTYHITVVSNGVIEGDAKVVNYTPLENNNDDEGSTTTTEDQTTQDPGASDEDSNNNYNINILIVIALGIVTVGSALLIFRKVGRV